MVLLQKREKCYFYRLEKINILIVVEIVMGPRLSCLREAPKPEARKVSRWEDLGLSLGQRLPVTQLSSRL